MKKISLLLGSAVFISACGGGGGSSGPQVDPNAPVVDAGSDQTVVERSGAVSLAGTASDADGTIDSVEWTQTGGSPSVTLTLSNTNNASFDAPQVSGTQVLIFSFSAEDNDGKTSSDSVSVTISDNAPLANAGADQSVASTDSVSLSGSASNGDAALSFQWSQTAGTNVALSPSASAQSPTFVAPNSSETLRFSLVVTDSDGDVSAADSVDITVTAPAPPVANAGPDQTANEQVVVQLNGSESSDSGGTITSYAWRQTSGTTVTLSSATAENPTFTAPELNGVANEVLTFELTVTDNDSSTATDTVDITVTNSHVDVSATFRFERVPLSATTGAGLDYSARSYQPARGITVAIGSNCGSSVKTVTDENGSFTTRVPVNTSTGLNACSELVSAGDATWQVSLVDNTNSNAQYGVRQAISTGNSDVSVGNIDIPSGWSDTSNAYTSPRLSGPFAILDSVYDAIQKTVAVNANFTFPALTINWSVNNTSENPCTGGRAAGCIGTSFYQAGNLFILGDDDIDTDEFDTHVVIHEWGHYFEDNLSRSDSIGGAHSFGNRLDMRVAFGEGFGNALSGIVTDDPVYRDSGGSRQAADGANNVENNSSTGWYDETTVQSVLYDIYDTAADGDDTLALGWGPLLNTFISSDYRDLSALTSIFSFLQQLKATDPSSSAAIDAFAVARGINGTDAYGAGETDDGSLPTGTVLPIYTALSFGAASTLCFTDDAGPFEAGLRNKLGNRRFATLQTAGSGTYSFVTSSSSGNGDTDVLIRLNGEVVHRLEAFGEENSGVALSAITEYVIEMYDYNNIGREDNLIRGDYCSTLTVSQP